MTAGEADGLLEHGPERPERPKRGAVGASRGGVTVAPSASAEYAGLLHELRKLRARSERAREQSVALGEAARWAGACTLATRDAMWHNRLQWRAWRAGWALWRRRSGDGGTPRAPRVCIVCDAVSFSPLPNARASADGGAAWVTAPAAMQERLRSQDAELGLVPDVCARCALGVDTGGVSAVAECASDEAWRQEIARLLLQVFAEVDAMAADTMASMPWIDAAEALDRTLAGAVERLRSRIPPAAMSALIEAVHGLVRRLRADPPGAPAARATGSGSRGAPGRFRPVRP